MSFSQKLSKVELSNQNDIASIVLLDNFIRNAGIENYKLNEIPGDASKRKYYRVLVKDGSYILMDARDDQASLAPFLEIGSLLLNRGFSAPKLYERDLTNGFLLLEDLGDNTFNRVLTKDIELEQELYNLAIDVLVELYRQDVISDLPEHSAFELNRGLEIFCEWYVKEHLPVNKIIPATRALIDIFTKLYQHLPKIKKVLVLRDYMADNLFYLPERNAIAQIGLIDFQDAHIGSPAYDMVSLLEDARRDISHSVVTNSINRYLNSLPQINSENFLNSYAILGMQRNLRIIGVFNRLNKAYGRTKYLNYLPRVWGYVKHGLEKPILEDVREWFKSYGVPIP
jgi:hypothetical protein